MSSQSQPPQPDNLGPEFSTDDALDDMLERLLLEDGTQWRADTAPEMAPFAQRVNAALREHRYANANGVYSPRRPGEERPMADHPVTLPPRPASQPPARRRPGAWSTLIAVAAAIAVVATLAGVLHTISNARVAAPIATPTLVAHVTHARGHWTDILHYAAGPYTGIFVSPLDPRIAYRAIYSATDPTSNTLARTTDGGATWTTLTLPADNGGWFGLLAFSPLDPQTVFLTLEGDPDVDSHCSSYAADQQQISGGYSCTFEYVSHDGGAHWAYVSFPAAATLFSTQGNQVVEGVAQRFYDYGEIGSDGFVGQVQGRTLFASVQIDAAGNKVIFDGVRLVSSVDGGSTWSVADSAIYAAGQVVTSYTAIPGTTTLYAISVPQQTPYGQDKNAALWSSEDSGAHWTRVGLAPVAPAALAGTTLTPGGATLYAVGQVPNVSGAPVPVFASRDGGRTWVPVPSTGRPQGQSTNPYSSPQYNRYPWSLSTLSDGSLLLPFFETPNADQLPGANISFYAWRPGDTTWFPVTPLPGGGIAVQAWLTSPANGPQSIWVVVAPKWGGNTTYTVLQCVLQ